MLSHTLAALALVAHALAAEYAHFRRCEQSGFCTRNRQLADHASAHADWRSPYALDVASVRWQPGELAATIVKTVDDEGRRVELPMTMSFLASGSVRLRMDEQAGVRRSESAAVRTDRFDQSEYSIVGGLELDTSVAGPARFEQGRASLQFGPDGAYTVDIEAEPFVARFKRDGETHIELNSQGLLNIEHWREREEDERTYAGYKPDTSAMREESFRGIKDTKPLGPESVALDISFPGYSHVYGIPEHASSLSLKETRGGGDDTYDQPYRLFNTDVGYYDADSPMALYGAIPFMQAHKPGSDVGVYWMNPSESWIDITKNGSSTHTHWMSEAGVLDLFIHMGPDARHIYKTQGDLFGLQQLPPFFSTGYHQCRWNYVSQADVLAVDKGFDRAHLPYDAVWLDVEYLDQRRYFTWHPISFSDPEDMLDRLDAHGHKLVAIIDPHLKRDSGYHVFTEASTHVVKTAAGGTYEGDCWPGTSVWVDFFSEKARSWWASLYDLARFTGSRRNLHVWNDMGEPAIFSGPDLSMPRDAVHANGYEHRHVHSLYGHLFINASHNGLVARTAGQERPFILTRAFTIGTSRFAASWTGDNANTWEHLRVATPMMLSNGIAGMSFCGADVGGFFDNPTRERLIRWYEAGIFYPFFRAHAHIDTKRREPYLLGDDVPLVRELLRLRQRLSPVWYTAFYRASIDGMPVLRPHFVAFPDDAQASALQDQFMLGDSGILVRPANEEGADTVKVHISDEEPYYDLHDMTVYRGAGAHTVPAPLGRVPALVRGGSIHVRRERIRRSLELTLHDPLTIVVYVDNAGEAHGDVYMDDGVTYDYREGAYVHRQLDFDARRAELRSSDAAEGTTGVPDMDKVRVERLVLVSQKRFDTLPTGSVVTVKQGDSAWTAGSLAWQRTPAGTFTATVRDPGMLIGRDWQVLFGEQKA